MNTILNIFNFIFINIISKPHFFIGIIVFIGYLAVGKKIYEAFAGFIKASIGFMILNVGSSGLIKNFKPIMQGLQQKYNMSAVVIDSNFGFNAALLALENIKATTSFTMFSLLIGFIWNILLVLFKKFTKIRTMFITGHIMVKQATVVTWIIFAAIPNMRNINGAILVGLLVGTYWAVFSNLTVEACENLVGSKEFAIGHQQMLGIYLCDKLAGKIGNNSKKTEDIKLPGILSQLNDNIVSTGVLMIIFFGTCISVIGKDVMKELDPTLLKGQISFLTYIIEKSLTFSVNIVILMTGVKMFVSELLESFTGIQEKILKGAIPAVDCAVSYGFANPNTLLWGFIMGTLGQLIAIISLLIFKSPIMMMSGFVPLFFDNTTLAIYANNKGGFKAATIIPFISGIIQVYGSLIAVKMFNLVDFGGWTGNLDWDTIWPVIGFFINHFKLIGAILVIIIMLLIPQIQYKNNKENYF